MTRPYQRLYREWEHPGGTIGLEESQIAQLEARYEIRLPEEFREYLRHVCPKNDYCMDGNGTDWWAFDRIKSVTDEYEHAIADPVIADLASTSLFFADYYLWCMAWAIVCAPGEHFGRVFVIGTAPDKFVADSFGEFVDKYMQDHGQVL